MSKSNFICFFRGQSRLYLVKFQVTISTSTSLSNFSGLSAKWQSIVFFGAILVVAYFLLSYSVCLTCMHGNLPSIPPWEKEVSFPVCVNRMNVCGGSNLFHHCNWMRQLVKVVIPPSFIARIIVAIFFSTKSHHPFEGSIHVLHLSPVQLGLTNQRIVGFFFSEVFFEKVWGKSSL